MNQEKKRLKNPYKIRPRGISIRWKLALYMSLFVVIILMITWLFQVFLLDIFFRAVKKNEMQEAAQRLETNLDSESLTTEAFNAAVDHSLCVMIYRTNGQIFSQIANVDATGTNVIMSLNDKRLAEFYLKAEENGGSRFARLAFGGFEVGADADMDMLFDNIHVNDENGRPIRIPSKNIRLVYIKVVETAANERYMILLDTSMQPLNATVQTLTTQYLWIAAIILLFAGITVFLLYRRISAPLIRMNESAKRLAQGKYDVEFSGVGYRETRELAATLNYASHELSRLDGLQKELIANISHDLRTPLTLIKGYGEVMRDLPGENTPENMQVIIDETTRLSELVNDLLDLSKIQSGAVVPSPSVFDLTNAVYDVMQRYDTLVKHRGYHVTFEAMSPSWVCADRGMLLQVLYNMINNAINYTGEDKTVTVTQTLKDGKVRISVTDTGAGIAPEEMPLIWDRYYKIDKVHKRAMIGTGLGLSIVKGILEKHNAAYGVNSAIGKGSTFWFELPLTDAPTNLIQNNTEE